MRRQEDGAAVVLAVGLMSLLVLIAVIGGGAVALVAVHRQVQAAADLAALAGAAAAASGGAPCPIAERVARRNGGDVSSCSPGSRDVLIVVERRLSGFFGDRTIRARARAGLVPETG